MVMAISTNPIANDAIGTSHGGSSSSTIVCDEHFREVSAIEVKLVSSGLMSIFMIKGGCLVVRAIGSNHLRPNRSNIGSDSGSIDDDLLEVIHVDEGQL